MKYHYLIVVLFALFIYPAYSIETLWDSGYPHNVLFNGKPTYLGFGCGNMSQFQQQRWAAMPFRMESDSTITQFTADYFNVGEPTTIRYIIWRRNGLTPPFDGEQVAFGKLSQVIGQPDLRISESQDWLHTFTGLNVFLRRGNYYFTVYGEQEGNERGNIIGWLTGATRYYYDITTNGIFLSNALSSPGFNLTQLNNVKPFAQNGTIQPNPSYCYSLCFSLKGYSEFPPMQNIRGTVKLKNMSTSVSGETIRFRLLDYNKNLIYTTWTTIDGAGNYMITIPYLPSNSLMLSAKASHWLSDALPIDTKIYSVINFELENGDVNGDNRVNDFDLNEVNGSLGNNNPGEMSGDLNEDGLIDELDLDIVNSAYGLFGLE